MTSQGDTLFALMNENIADESSARTVATQFAASIASALNKPFSAQTPLEPGKRYTVTVDQNAEFLKATIELDPANVFHAAAQGDRIHCWKEEVVLDFKIETLQFRVKGTLTESVLNAGEGTELAQRLANVFKWDIDFQSESVRGDTCKLLFERRYADDRPSGYGNILCAVYKGKKTEKTAILFNNQYFDAEGVELKKDFLRSPLTRIRVTSHYSEKRYHPVLRVWRKHNGVDYGAPAGTPVWAVSHGVVTFAGWHNGYGNYVCVKHDNGYESRYGHLQKYFVQTGDRVKQMQRIGLVGKTGLATGPHLDFQLLVKDKHVNPLSVKMVKSLRKIPDPLIPRFEMLAGARIGSLQKVAFGSMDAHVRLAP
ncbi:MAG TPA: M23 family metallopeptidase [Desulfomonilaceae bacterium]|nr:M23 family metallopeptidase [Desulfomonilaceae bacterium]